jgi:hypothetical protein
MKDTIARVRAKIPEQKDKVKNSVKEVRISFQRVKARIPEQKERVRNSVAKVRAKIPEQVREVKRRAARKVVSVILFFVGVLGIITYRNFIIIELGLLGALCDLVYELYGTKKGWWSYDNSHSHYMIAGRLPIGVVFTYFCMGMVAATYVLSRLTF